MKKFLEKARKVHGDKYDYSKVEYVNCKTKVCIICPIHGEFWQTPDNHLQGKGCKECSFSKIPLRKTTEQFIEEARKVHGNKYDYSKTIYNGIKEKVIITCPIHGDFEIIADYHLSKNVGCPKCNINNDIVKRKINFINKANKIYGNIFDYSKVNYIDGDTKVCIICPIHGEFWQTPSNHLQGKGCKECLDEKVNKNSCDKFIKQAKEIHGDKYDYSKVKYIRLDRKVCIICKKHGEFWQTPISHLRGVSGCNKCNLIKKQKAFIEKANEIHNNEYDYSKVNYIKSSKKVCIICKEHGEFWQTPNNHLKGNKCPKCCGKNKTTNDFINESCIIHNNKYDYSKVEYVSAKTKVCIICPEHGEFWQTPNKHLQGHGCPHCKMSHLETEIEKLLIDNDIKFEKQKTFKWLINENHMYLDFYLPQYNIAIECQGNQHFNDKCFFKSNDFNKILERDIKKNKLCYENNIRIIYYTHENKYDLKDKKYNNIYECIYYTKNELLNSIYLK